MSMKEKDGSCVTSRFWACTTGRMELPSTAGAEDVVDDSRQVGRSGAQIQT